jgi:hypothetical protein
MKERVLAPQPGGYLLGEGEAYLRALVFQESVFDLTDRARAEGTVTNPQAVCVLGQPETWLYITVTPKPRTPGHKPRSVEYGFRQLLPDQLLPSDWFKSGDRVSIERR